MTSRFSFVDLFAGIGGFHLALRGVGGECVAFSEIAHDAISAYCENLRIGPEANLGDITKLDELPPHDFLTGGVPCQSWSIAGRNLGFDDDRGQLWNDTLFLLNRSRPKAFIFENVKGLADPRNRRALDYIMGRIAQAGYHARCHLLNAYDYGVPQTRVRIYIVGFREKVYSDRFCLPPQCPGVLTLSDVVDGMAPAVGDAGGRAGKPRWSLSCNSRGLNDYFLFNDLRGGSTTLHSWDIQETTERQRRICELMLRNRRKKTYGILDGNPLSLDHLRELDASISQAELDELVDASILKRVDYEYELAGGGGDFSEAEAFLLSLSRQGRLRMDWLRADREARRRKIGIADTLASLEAKGAVCRVGVRYDFKNGKISTGLNGINRVFLPSSKIYPTLVASDTNDYISTVAIEAGSLSELRREFLERVYKPRNFRKITRAEACRIQGFPADYALPEARPRWMKLIGNSVAVPVVARLALSVVRTGVFGEGDWDGRVAPPCPSQMALGFAGA